MYELSKNEALGAALLSMRKRPAEWYGFQKTEEKAL
jgi:hypothetical protein